jgi:hypothetical protein
MLVEKAASWKNKKKTRTTEMLLREMGDVDGGEWNWLRIVSIGGIEIVGSNLKTFKLKYSKL